MHKFRGVSGVLLQCCRQNGPAGAAGAVADFSNGNAAPRPEQAVVGFQEPWVDGLHGGPAFCLKTLPGALEI